MPVRLERPADHPHVAVVTLDRPEKANALDPGMLSGLAAAWREIAAIVKANGGWTKQSLAIYGWADRHDDQVWDVWRLEGPGFPSTQGVHAEHGRLSAADPPCRGP